MIKPRFAIGTKYKTRGKVSRICTVVDVLRTYNAKDELVSIRYVSSHEFMGQTVLNRDVVETTIAMGLIDTCPKCFSENIANEGPEEDSQIEITCHDCSYQWTEPV